uniref:tRNA (5-methylaminomethyl-2-thiouridylate)-methyltransferase n=1 Tax=Trepomonas sp. PC1 TaxID=1076344 RepID=A0A146KB74_9EUKA|eukprot:JAP92639.1 tRNA (5-methylaminomethyl-2-thiouridylate)-methyltransferase [Trepomonas sp. PC1]
MPKCVLLFNGGIDSTMAARMLQENNIEVLLLNLTSPFFPGPTERTTQVAKMLKLPLTVIDISKQMLYLTESPRKGYGKFANPCIDCRANMLQIAHQFMVQQKADFIATGDVFNQHFISQNTDSFIQQLKLANIPDIICRPLCQQLCKPNLSNKFFSAGVKIQGQQHKEQESFLKSRQINIYKYKAQTCKLLNNFFSQKVLVLKQDSALYQFPFLVQLLLKGRFFRFSHRKYLFLYRKHECQWAEQFSQCGVALRSLPQIDQKTLVLVVSLAKQQKEAVFPVFDFEDTFVQGKEEHTAEIDDELRLFALQLFAHFSKLDQCLVGEELVSCQCMEGFEKVVEQKAV